MSIDRPAGYNPTFTEGEYSRETCASKCKGESASNCSADDSERAQWPDGESTRSGETTSICSTSWRVGCGSRGAVRGRGSLSHISWGSSSGGCGTALQTGSVVTSTDSNGSTPSLVPGGVIDGKYDLGTGSEVYQPRRFERCEVPEALQGVTTDIIGGNNDEIVWRVGLSPRNLSVLALDKLWSINREVGENALEESDKERERKECGEHVRLLCGALVQG